MYASTSTSSEMRCLTSSRMLSLVPIRTTGGRVQCECTVHKAAFALVPQHTTNNLIDARHWMAHRRVGEAWAVYDGTRRCEEAGAERSAMRSSKVMGWAAESPRTAVLATPLLLLLVYSAAAVDVSMESMRLS